MQTVIVVAAILVERARVLLTQRKPRAHLAGLWEFPGGKVESGEDPKHALARELREEVGIEASIGPIVNVTFHRYDDADKAVLLLFYEATRREGSAEPVAIDVAACRWAQASELDPAHFPPADVEMLREVRARLEADAVTR